jgi:hypothetical protein
VASAAGQRCIIRAPHAVPYQTLLPHRNLRFVIQQALDAPDGLRSHHLQLDVATPQQLDRDALAAAYSFMHVYDGAVLDVVFLQRACVLEPGASDDARLTVFDHDGEELMSWGDAYNREDVRLELPDRALRCHIQRNFCSPCLLHVDLDVLPILPSSSTRRPSIEFSCAGHATFFVSLLMPSPTATRQLNTGLLRVCHSTCVSLVISSADRQCSSCMSLLMPFSTATCQLNAGLLCVCYSTCVSLVNSFADRQCSSCTSLLMPFSTATRQLNAGLLCVWHSTCVSLVISSADRQCSSCTSLLMPFPIATR